MNSQGHCLRFIPKCISFSYKAAICSITNIPSGQKQKHNKTKKKDHKRYQWVI